mgnify:CR=1 FL=1
MLTAPLPAESLATVSRGLVQLLRHRTGRGPTEARVSWAGEDALLALFEGGYTKVEETLVAGGHRDKALAYRQALLDALESELCAVVEDALGRPVHAVVARPHRDLGVTAVVFVLARAGGGLPG